MGPLAILGSVAAVVQLADTAAGALLKSLKTAKRLREIPTKMAETLDDVEKSIERIRDILQKMLQPGSDVFDRLTTEQRDRLYQCTDNIRLATEELHGDLQPLVDDLSKNKSNAVKDLWKRWVSLQMEHKLAQGAEKVRKLKMELVQELQITGIELQSRHAKESTRAWKVHEASSNVIISQTKDTQESLRTISLTLTDHARSQQDSFATVQQDLASVQLNQGGYHDQLVHIGDQMTNVGGQITNVGNQVMDACSQLSSNERLTRDRMDQMVQYQAQHQAELRQEVVALKSELLAVFSGQHQGLSKATLATAMQLNDEDKRRVETSTRVDLMSRPSSVKDALESSLSQGGNMLYRCNCNRQPQIAETKVWRLKFRKEATTTHSEHCMLYRTGARSWSYSVLAWLYPFLNQTMELTIGASTGAGIWTISPPLRFHGTVKRSDSPLFQAFDRFNEFCYDRRMDTGWWRLRHPLDKDDFIDTLEQLQFLRMTLQQLVTDGKASGSDSDENGDTILVVSTPIAISLNAYTY
ncbi:hypothetical protein GGR56DRAFT_646689 [Xylariaceae sp. FL0804]|nr:hypothetical protein GGR56DRAFT_646689 [Xylariaceae sp. FL0804]